jgi:DNA-binding transcriptional LysR family regulator
MTAARAFLQSLALAPADMAKLAHGNADRLLKLGAPVTFVTWMAPSPGAIGNWERALRTGDLDILGPVHYVSAPTKSV